MTEINCILLDMDGVIANFAKQVAKLARTNGDDHFPSESNFVDFYGFHSTTDMWTRIDREGVDFWSKMEPYEWADELVASLQRLAKVVICTSPSANPLCANGKLHWLQTFFKNRFFRDFMITPRKEVCARPDTLLIDDTQRNIDKFAEAGGLTLLFPMPWNENRSRFSQDPGKQIDAVRDLLLELASAT